MKYAPAEKPRFWLSGAAGVVERPIEDLDAVVAQVNADLDEVAQRARSSVSASTMHSTRLGAAEVARRLGVSHG